MAEAISLALKRYKEFDPRYVVLILLVSYNVLGITVLGFNRSWDQIIVTALSAVLLQSFYDITFKGRVNAALSAFITSMGLCILLNYGHSLYYPLVPVFFAISSKYFFTLRGRHTFNPALMGVVLSLLITQDFISPAPAYQWNGIGAFGIFIAMPAILFFMPKINRTPLVLSFLGVFTLQIILRSILIKHYLPFNTLFFGTLTSPPFFLFTFFMITDPATSPNGKKDQIIAGSVIALLDLMFHLVQSYHTFFYAGVSFGMWRFLRGHWLESKKSDSLGQYLENSFIETGYYRKMLLILGIGFGGYFVHHFILEDHWGKVETHFQFEQLNPSQTGLHFEKGEILDSVDPRVQHMGKWILAITDGIAVGDINQDGLQDILMTNGHKSAKDRAALFLNKGDFKFERYPLPEVSERVSDFHKYGVASNAMFVDYDNDGDLDLYMTYAFGKEGSSRLFKNGLSETGKIDFKDVTDELGLNIFTNAAAANWLDLNRDGKLDLIIGNTISTYLPDYKVPTKLDFFSLPKAEYEGDVRMFNFMHDSWHMANNGAVNPLFVQQDSGFKKLDEVALNMSETRWTMAIGTADFNQDGWTDLYMANDFGPDDLYLSKKGESFENIKGDMFGTIGRDTYKGMNATIIDFDQNGWMDMYVSNVHHALQAEGSLLWSFRPNPEDSFHPIIEEKATYTGAINEDRFGWGAGAGDFNNDGLIDLAQANGMVDDAFDKKFDKCPDYWYINEKIARSPPQIHRYINNWGDIRGTCIHGHEKNKLYMNRGTDHHPQFVDVADTIGMDQKGNWRGMAVADFDNDGRLDLIATSLYRDPLVFHNKKTDFEGNWIGLDIVSTKSECNREAVGSRVIVQFWDSTGVLKRLVQEKVVVNGFSAQSDRRLHFGLGPNVKLDRIIVNWCGKELKEYSAFSINKYHQIAY
ncbi:MAG: hypothetical protein COW00_13285 [Bdellovibrio sp. CG12_big_fil_rev_8_21_14_0_65_39_13]|nr:MAG: hypothetical protein COW78_11335 [Bdellovibrio sp. CG22_combo_CG10-13_8_21_14_all_39_27]PIQ58903.1 MAG: hypothetical protein COW00_13285 [Bdellovibrio sp. CG12_big_fil_rev_8_21_14_0_65_39_13]PIR35994.1 MAG: hypothetical protein COV37_05660 [Bdellovibrio sp. CG11_big_fil_rev_8_21_14_0_20_39_38]